MKTKFCIATTKVPEDFDLYVGFVQSAMESNTDHPVKLLGYVIVDGYNCANHGVFIEGHPDDATYHIEQLTMMLQPGRYSRVGTDDSAVKEGQFEMNF